MLLSKITFLGKKTQTKTKSHTNQKKQNPQTTPPQQKTTYKHKLLNMFKKECQSLAYFLISSSFEEIDHNIEFIKLT